MSALIQSTPRVAIGCFEAGTLRGFEEEKDSTEIYIIYGFCRQFTFMVAATIPLDIVKLVLTFFKMNDCWDPHFQLKDDNGKTAVALSNNNHVAKKISSFVSYVFGINIAQKPGKYIWKLRINKSRSNSSTCNECVLGIAAETNQQLKRKLENLCAISDGSTLDEMDSPSFILGHADCYGINGETGCKYVGHRQGMESTQWEKYCFGLIQGDVVSVELDFGNTSLAFAVNNDHYGNAFTKLDPNQKYRIFAAMWGKHQEIELLSFLWINSSGSQ